MNESRSAAGPDQAARSAKRDHPSQRDGEPAYVLHSYAFKETSLVVEVFARNCGRLGLVARGARRPRSALRGVLMAFQPLLLAWSGTSELRLLQRAEWQAGFGQLQGLPLVCALYMNELLIRLLAREDAHEGLYDAYARALEGLRTAAIPAAAVLRRFEKRLLAELGYALSLECDCEGTPIEAAGAYTYLLERGPSRLSDAEAAHVPLVLRGRTLLGLGRDELDDPLAIQESRTLMRYVLNHYLGGKVLHTRQLLTDPQPA